MNVKQQLAILFYRKRKKQTRDGKIPIYVRVTIDGLQEEFSTGIKVLDADWDDAHKRVLSTDPLHKTHNKKLGQTQTDLERHFDLMQVKHDIATPRLVLDSYKTPLNGERRWQEKVQNVAFSEGLDALIADYLSYCEKIRKAYEFDAIPRSA